MLTRSSLAFPAPCSQMKQRLRAELYSDFLSMGQAKMPVDAATYSLVQSRLADPTLCGPHAKTDATPPPPPPPPPASSKSSKPRSQTKKAKAIAKAKKPTKPPTHFEVDCITAESGAWGGSSRWFFVKWKGYHASWEAYRVRGEPGTPVETWEPLRTMRMTEALKAWDAATDAASA